MISSTVALSTELCKNNDPSYNKILYKLEQDLQQPQIPSATDDENMVVNLNDLHWNLLTEFSSNYMMPKELWQFYYNLATVNSNFDRIKGLTLPAYYHFYFNQPSSNAMIGIKRSNNINKLIDYKQQTPISSFELSHGKTIFIKNIKNLEKDLIFPHSNLKKKWILYEKNIASPPPKTIAKKYEKMLKIYEKIISIEIGKDGDEENEKWFKTLEEVEDDDEFIQQNVEYKIGEFLGNRILWKFYIQFLKQRNNIKQILHVYSKYCRFFLDDMEMKKEYRKEVLENYGKKPFEVPWKNVFDFEIYNENVLKQLLQAGEKKENSEDPEEEDEEKKAGGDNHQCGEEEKLYFNPKNLKSQNFSLSKNLMHYILQNSNAEVLQKLFETCKFFFTKNSIPICFKLILKENNTNNDLGFPEIRYYKQSMEAAIISQSLQPSKNSEKFLQNFYISNYLWIQFRNPNALSELIIPNLFRCDAKYITIFAQNLNEKELKFLIGNGKVENLNLHEVKIIDVANGADLPVEEILKMTPKLNSINITAAICSPQTTQILKELPFQNKFETFILSGIQNDLFNAEDFAEFLKKNAAPKSRITIHFKSHDNADYITNFRGIVTAAINGHWKTDEKPIFKTF